MSQKKAGVRSSGRVVKETHFETDPEIAVARSLRYEHRDTKFVFTNGQKILVASIENDKWPLGTTLDEKLSLKPGDPVKIILNRLPCDVTFLGRGSAKAASSYKTKAELRLIKGLELEFLDCPPVQPTKKSLSQNPLTIVADTVTAQEVTVTPVSSQNQSSQVFSQASQPVKRKLVRKDNVEVFREQTFEENVPTESPLLLFKPDASLPQTSDSQVAQVIKAYKYLNFLSLLRFLKLADCLGFLFASWCSRILFR